MNEVANYYILTNFKIIKIIFYKDETDGETFLPVIMLSALHHLIL